MTAIKLPKENYDIKINAQTSSYGEVVDTIADILEIGMSVEKELQDGFQVTDLFAIIPETPTIKEVVNDFPVFAAEFVQLDPVTATKAIDEAANRIYLNGNPGKVVEKILEALQLLAESYGFAFKTYARGNELLLRYKSFLGIAHAPF